MSNDLHGDALVARLMDDLPVAVWVAMPMRFTLR